MKPYMLLLLITISISICFRIGYYLNSPFNFSDDHHPSHLPNCNASALLSLSSSDPGEMNRLRRKLALENPSCYEHHFSAFANYTMSRLSSIKKHLSLHIPKSGGTSLCELAKLKNETVGDTNCWEKDHFLPLWCYNQFANGDRKEWTNEDNNNAATCDEIVRLLPKFIMNENYLDYPLCLRNQVYSILLRDPVDRVMSSERHLMTFQIALHRNDIDTQKRLAFLRNNYLTWAIASGTTEHGKRLRMTPNRKHLELAKDTLSRFDFLLELSRHAICQEAILHLMGFGEHEIQHLNVKKGALMQNNNFSREQYEAWNSLDIELHQYARDLIELDCEFYVKVVGKNRS